MNNFKIIFATTTRNPSRSFLKSFFQMKKIGENFKDQRIIIIESDSDKNLNEYFKEISNEPRVIVKRLGSLKNKIKHGKLRTERIAFSRNEYISMIKNSKDLIGFDFLAIYDSDGASRMINYKSIEAALKINTDWTAQFANQLFFYYDIFALRAKGWVEKNPKEIRESLIVNKMSEKKAYIKAFSRNMKHIKKNGKLINVESAFGSFGIYKIKDIGNAFYRGNLNGKPYCEHVTFNLDLIAQNKKLFINPNLISSLGFPQHTFLPKFLIYLLPEKVFKIIYKNFGGSNKKYIFNKLFDYFN